MSLLSICQNVLAETGWPIFDNVAQNTEATAKQIFTLANTEIRAISESLNWPQLEVEYPFNTVAAQPIYLWPSDFRILAPQALFNKDQYYEVKGSTGLQYWELLKYGKLSSLCWSKFRVVYPLGQPGIELTPAPNGIAAMVGVYYSGEFARAADGTSIPLYANDSDVSKVPERYVELGLKWRFRRAKGLDFSAELAEYNNTVQTQYSKYMALGEIKVGGRRPSEYDGLTSGYVRENGFGA